MKKKLISLVCAISMIATLFASFTVVRAANQAIVGTATKNGNTVTLKVDYSGFTKVSVAQFTAKLPTDVFKALEKNEDDEVIGATAGDAFGSATINYDNGDLIFVWAASKKSEYAAGEGTLLTATLTLKDDVEVPDEIALESIIFNDELESGKVSYGTADQKAQNPIDITNAAINDPSATAKPKNRPKTTEVDPPSVPVTVEGQQIKGTATLDGKKVTLTVDYSDFTKVSVAQFTAKIPASVFKPLEKNEDDEVIGATAGDAFGSATINYDNGDLIFVWAASKKSEYAAGEGTLLTASLELQDDVTLPQTIALESIIFNDELESGKVSYGTADQKAQNPIGITNAVVKADPSSSDYDKKDITLVGDVLDDTKAITGEDDTADGTTPYYVVVTATDKNGDPANYGEHYTAYYNGVPLSEAQMNNYLAGKYGKISDVLKNMTFDANSGVTITAELDKQDPSTGKKTKITEGDVTVSSGKVTPTPKPTTAPTMSIVTTVGGKVTNKVTEKSILTAIVDVPEKLQVGGAYLLDYLDVDKEGYLELISSKVDEDGLGATFKFQALKAGKVTLTASYVDGDDDDTNLVATKTTTLATAKTTVQITKESSSSGSSSSSSSDKSTSSGGGAIALGNQKGTTGNHPGTTTNFPDIEGVASWAGPAITRLAAEGIVAGRDDGTFDPDANITRAEYCQMLVQTINKSGVYADVNYDDVPTDAWFYHAVAVASSLGIVEGFGDNTFHPYELITREQMARMTMAATKVQGIYLNNVQSVSFSDDADIADWSRDSVYTLAEAGVINGMDDGSYFAPRANATRAQAAVIIYNAFFEGK